MSFSEPYFQHLQITDVTLRVRDLARVSRLYRDILGFLPVASTETRLELSATGKAPALLVFEVDEAASPRRSTTSGLFHTAILYPDRASLGRIARRLFEHGVRFGTGDHGVSEALYLDDPEGNGVELYADRARDRWPKPSSPDEPIGMYTEAVDLDPLVAEGDASTGPVLPATTRIGHIHLSVADLADTEAFYGKNLGFPITVRSYPGALFFGRDGYHHHLGTNVWRSRLPAEAGALGLLHFCLRYVDKVEVARIAAENAQPIAPDGTVSLRDPSGIRVIVT